MEKITVVREKKCEYCGEKFKPVKRINSTAKYCSGSCRTMAYNQRQLDNQVELATGSSSPPFEDRVPRIPVTGKSAIRDEEALFQLYKAGRRTEITRDELSAAGFNTTGFGTRLESSGCELGAFKLSRKLPEKTYTLSLIVDLV